MLGLRTGRVITKLGIWYGERRFHAILVRAGVVLLLFVIDPLGVAVQKSRAVDKTVSWLTGNVWSYVSSNRLAVVLIDEDDLRSSSFRVDWPIPYSKTASIIRILACARVAGVFFDFTASQQFNLAAGQADLQDMVKDSSKAPRCNDDKPPDKIPVYFGVGDVVDTPFSRKLNESGRAFWIGGNANDPIYAPGRSYFPSEPSGDAKDQSPAFGITRILCVRYPKDPGLCPDGDLAKARLPLRLFWTAEESKDQHQILRARSGMECRRRLTYWEEMSLIVGFTDVGRYQTCPPVLTLLARQLFAEYDDIDSDSTRILSGRFVFVGARLFGLNDTVSSPVHGDLPGVYVHAVALDNLWHFHQNYPTKPEPYVLLLIAGTVFTVIELFRELCGDLKYSLYVNIAISSFLFLFVTLIVQTCNWSYSLLLGIFGYYFAGSALVGGDKVKKKGTR